MSDLSNRDAGYEQPQDPLHKAVRGLFTVVILVTSVAALHFGEPIFVPLALAVLLSFAVSPLVRRLARWGLPHAAAVGTVVASTLAMVVIGFVFVAGQVVQLANDLPTYQTAIQKKLQTVRSAVSKPGPFESASKSLRAIGIELLATQRAIQSQVEGEAKSSPSSAAVTATSAPPPSDWPTRATSGVVDAMGTASLVLIFMIFILLEQNELRDRVLRLMGGHLRQLTEALNEAGLRVGRYLNAQLLVNAGFGIPFTIGLWLIGVPGAILWGLLAMALRFVPYAGPLVSATFPLLLAFAVDPGWDMLMWTAALILTLELITNNIIEPMAYGSSTGLAPLALLVCTVFWAVMWGPIGLILATPLTVCLVVIGRHVHTLKFLDLLLGSEPAFDRPTQFYQRLAMEQPHDALEFALKACKRSSRLEFFNQVAMPCLKTIAMESEENSVIYQQRAVHGLRAVVERLQAFENFPPQEPEQASNPKLSVACMGLRTGLDAVAARITALGLSTNPHLRARSDNDLRTLDPAVEVAPQVLVISTFSSAPQPHLRFLLKKLRQQHPMLRVIIAAWNHSHPSFKGPEWMDFHDVSCVNNLLDLLGLLSTFQQSSTPIRPVAGTQQPSSGRTSHQGPPDIPWRERALATTAKLSALFDSPLAFVWQGDDILIHATEEADGAELFIAMSCGALQQKFTQAPENACETSVLNQSGMRSSSPDTHARFMEVGAFTAVPLKDADEGTIGMVGFGHARNRVYSPEEKALLTELASGLQMESASPRLSQSAVQTEQPAPETPPRLGFIS